MLSLFEKNKTFKPRKKLEATNPRYELHKLANEILKATLGAGEKERASFTFVVLHRYVP